MGIRRCLIDFSFTISITVTGKSLKYLCRVKENEERNTYAHTYKQREAFYYLWVYHRMKMSWAVP